MKTNRTGLTVPIRSLIAGFRDSDHVDAGLKRFGGWVRRHFDFRSLSQSALPGIGRFLGQLNSASQFARDREHSVKSQYMTPSAWP